MPAAGQMTWCQLRGKEPRCRLFKSARDRATAHASGAHCGSAWACEVRTARCRRARVGCGSLRLASSEAATSASRPRSAVLHALLGSVPRRLACVPRARAAAGLQRTAQRGGRTAKHGCSARLLGICAGGRERRRRAALAVTLRSAGGRCDVRAAWLVQRSTGSCSPPSEPETRAASEPSTMERSVLRPSPICARIFKRTCSAAQPWQCRVQPP